MPAAIFANFADLTRHYPDAIANVRQAIEVSPAPETSKTSCAYVGIVIAALSPSFISIPSDPMVTTRFFGENFLVFL